MDKTVWYDTSATEKKSAATHIGTQNALVVAGAPDKGRTAINQSLHSVI